MSKEILFKQQSVNEFLDENKDFVDQEHKRLVEKFRKQEQFEEDFRSYIGEELIEVPIKTHMTSQTLTYEKWRIIEKLDPILYRQEKLAYADLLLKQNFITGQELEDLDL